MIREGAVVLLRFPHTDGEMAAKMRPGLVIRRVPGEHDDWLVCMLSTRTDQWIEGTDELIAAGDGDFPASGLKAASIVRVCRLAIAHRSAIAGSIGVLGPTRLSRIRAALVRWITGSADRS